MEYRDYTDAVMASVRRKERTIGKRVRIDRKSTRLNSSHIH